MAGPGEVSQAVGAAYQCVFVAALEATIRGFEQKFDVRTEPEKVSFTSRTGRDYSFDFGGVYRRPWHYSEVLGECKGYSKGDGLLSEFRSFLAKAYVASTDYRRHRNDYFWFVTNVPFGCSEGSGIRNYDFIKATLTGELKTEVKDIIGDSHVDTSLIGPLAQRIGIFILTDSFLMSTDLSYKVKDGENLWVILKRFSGGHAPAQFGVVAKEIASKNGLRSPDHIASGKRLRLSWQGIRPGAGGGLGGF